MARTLNFLRDEVNPYAVASRDLSRAEAIRKFVIVEEDWTEENGYLTPSFKVKRHMVVRDLHDTIEALYVR